MIFALPLVPLVAAGLLLPLRERPRALGATAIAALLLTLALGAWAAATEPTTSWAWSPVLDAQLAVAGFGRVMVVLIPVIAAPIVAYAAATEHEGRLRLFVLMLAFVGAMLLLVVAADFLTLLIAWELVGAASWALIGHGWRDEENARDAAVAFVTTRFGDLGLYAAAGLAFAAVGTLRFDALGAVDRPALDAIAAGVLVAAAAKSAQVPFSPWLFSAMAGPTPVSALLHSATMVAAGAYLLIRLAPALEPVEWFLPAVTAVGLTTALAGGVVAVVQPRAKRVLAGSTSAQYGLMFVAVGVGSTAAAGAHLVAHAAFKSLLFLGAGIAIHAVGSRELADMRLGRLLPWAAALSAVGALALAAVPPFGAAWTKDQIVAAATEASPWLAVATLAAGLLGALYAARYYLLAYGPRAAATHAPSSVQPSSPGLLHRPAAIELGSVAVLAALTVLLSALWLPSAARFVERATGGELAGITASELAASAALIAVAFTLAWWALRRDRLLAPPLPAGLRTTLVEWLGLTLATRALVVAPVLALSRRLAAFDDRVVDAGVRGVVRLSALVSRALSWGGEWTFDGAVQGIASLALGLSNRLWVAAEGAAERTVRGVALSTVALADGSRNAAEGSIDGVVEGGARLTGAAARTSRRIQTGLTHQYYVIIAAGVAGLLAALVLGR